MIQNEFTFDAEEAERQSGKTMQLLDMLKQCPHTNAEMSQHGFLRYGAYIRELRKRGYDIRTEKGRELGEWVYSYVGQVERVKCERDAQDRYYASTHWRQLRQARLEMDDFKCCHCRSTDRVQVHHWDYDLFSEDIEDIVTLCARCHERVHAYAGVRISFPDYITRQQAELLGLTPTPNP